MATINPTVSVQQADRNGSVIKATWASMANGDVGAPVEFPEWADRSVQVEGTFGAGGSAAWQGSNDATNYRSVTDPQGTAIAVTTASIKQVTEITAFQRPNITAGDGTTALTVSVIMRRAQQIRT